MSSIRSINTSSASQVQQGSGSRPARGGNPGERLNNDLTSFLKQEGVSSEGQAKIKSEFSVALESMSSTSSQADPSQVKEALSKVLSSNGLDGDTFVSGLGTPQGNKSDAVQGGQGQRPRGGGPPPPPKETTSNSSSSETSYIEDLLEALTNSTTRSNESSASQSQSNVLPGTYINRSGGNLDAQA